MRPGYDALLLALLLIARVRIDTLADAAVLPLRFQDVARQPWLGRLFSAEVTQAFGARYADPLALLLIALSFAALALYLIVDGLRTRLPVALTTRLKWRLLIIIVLLTVAAPTFKLILLRQGSGPASYSHDGGVIQTEATIQFFLAGQNPYQADYTKTPMAEWGFDEYRTALYHYPYLPWTFVFSTPWYLLSQAVLGWYDQRFVYLALFLLMLALIPGLARRAGAGDQTAAGSPALALTALLALNPIMANDVIFGQNDSFVLFWLLLALWLWRRAVTDQARPRRGLAWLTLSAVCFGLACASKPTAWFLAPFYAVLLLQPAVPGRGAGWRDQLRLLSSRLLPAVLAFALLVLPYAVWDFNALLDDVWRWSNGTAAQAYQIWGWGANNFVLALGLVRDRFAYWPFWIPQLLVAAPALVWLLRRQWLDNSLAGAAWRYGLFLFLFLFVSRFLNENYLGFVLAFWALGYFGADDANDTDCTQSRGALQ